MYAVNTFTFVTRQNSDRGKMWVWEQEWMGDNERNRMKVDRKWNKKDDTIP